VPQIVIAWIFKQSLDVFSTISSTKEDNIEKNFAALVIE